MDPHEPRICHWEGCFSFDVILGGVYCLEHKAQYHQGHRPQSDKNQAFSNSSSNSPLGLPRNSFSINPFSSGTASPTNEKKQLPDKHTARKSVKQPSNSGQAHIASATSPARKPSVDILPANPRPVKRQRPTGVPNVSGLYSRSDSSSFSENGISHLSSRGMFRQSEERTYKLSAVDDFALRPKKKEAANESARSKLYDQRQSHRGDIHLSNSGRPVPTSSKPPQPTSLKSSVRSGSFVIDLTRDDDSGPPLPRPKFKPSPNNHTPNGITAGLQKPQRPSNKSHYLPCEQKDIPASENKQLCEGPPLFQPGGNSQTHHGHLVEQTRDLRTQNPLQNVISSAPTVQPTSKPLNGIISEAPISKQKSNMPALNNDLGPVHMNSSDTSTRQHNLPPIKDRQLTNGIHPPSLDEKSSAPVDSSLGASVVEQMMAKKIIKPSVQSEPIPDAPPTPFKAMPVAPLQQTTIRQGGLSALLGGREWKKMLPEERRLFWVSQHDAGKLDAQIYSENNRPFRPGDPLFGADVDTLPSRPQRPAAHFDYIDPRTHHSHQQSEEWYQRKQKEIAARDNRKTDLGEVVKRAVQRKQAASKPNQKRKRDSLPQRVRENPKWLKAIEVLEQIEAQARNNKEASQPRREKTAKGKAKATPTIELDSDTDMQSS
ncbi:hypothetical protein F4782DRAFT_387700 [Xylaria castorea]|nr:hypothetical protein F4782DRAFT_387700 [Xylaria castorea]